MGNFPEALCPVLNMARSQLTSETSIKTNPYWQLCRLLLSREQKTIYQIYFRKVLDVKKNRKHEP